MTVYSINSAPLSEWVNKIHTVPIRMVPDSSPFGPPQDDWQDQHLYTTYQWECASHGRGFAYYPSYAEAWDMFKLHIEREHVG